MVICYDFPNRKNEGNNNNRNINVENVKIVKNNSNNNNIIIIGNTGLKYWKYCADVQRGIVSCHGEGAPF